MKNANANIPAFAWIITTFMILTGRAAGQAAGGFVLEGKVEAVSRLPNPAESSYKDCLFTLKVFPNTTRQPPEAVMLSVHGFTNRVFTAHAAIKAGDLIRVEARRFDEMPGAYRELQLVDEFGEVELPLLAVLTVSRIPAFSAPLAGAPWAENEVVRKPIRVVEPLPEEVAARLADMRRDLQELQALRDARGGWARWYDELAAIRSNLAARLEAAPEGYLREGDFVLGEVKSTLGYTLKDEDPWYRSMISSLVGMRDQFAKAGTDLILAPIPMRDHVYAAKFIREPPADGVLQPYWLKFRHDLLSRGVEVVDLVAPFTQALETRPFLYHAHSHDGHPGGDGAVLAAEVIGRRLKRYTFHAPPPVYKLEPAVLRLPSSEEFYFPGPAEIPYVRVLEKDGQPIGENHAAEALLIGDSMVTAPPSGPNGSIGAHAAHQAGVAMRYFKRAGSAHALTYHLSMVQDPGFFSGRRVCVFVFSASCLTATNRPWRLEPFMDHALRR